MALCGLFSASEAGVTERDVIFPLLAVSVARLWQRLSDLPKAEEVSHFFLARVVSNVLDLEFDKLAPGAQSNSSEPT